MIAGRCVRGDANRNAENGSFLVKQRVELKVGIECTVRERLVDGAGINLAGVQRLLTIAEAMQRIRPLMDESALSTGAGRRQLLTEMRRLNEAIGL